MDEPIDVLVVEDDPYDVEIIGRQLAADFPHARVKWIDDGERALRFLLGFGEPAQLPKLVLLDLHLPRMGGLEVLERLRADRLTKYLPVVVLTGTLPDAARTRRAYALGANSYVAKPSSQDEYIKSVRSVVAYWLQQNVPPGE